MLCLHQLFLRFTEMRSELDSVSGLAELNFEIRMKENIWIIEILNAMFVYICVLISLVGTLN